MLKTHRNESNSNHKRCFNFLKAEVFEWFSKFYKSIIILKKLKKVGLIWMNKMS